MNRTKVEWGDLFTQISSLAKRPVKEIHATDLIPGNREWRGVDPAEFRVKIAIILDWLAERKHSVTFAAVDKNEFENLSDRRKTDLKNPWNVAAFHIVLTVQRAHQKEKKNKGHTLFIFDMGQPPETLVRLIVDPPTWSGTYYGFDKKREALDQIIDVPMRNHITYHWFRLPIFICYILRRFSDLEELGSKEKYEGEHKRIQTLGQKNLCAANFTESQISDEPSM